MKDEAVDIGLRDDGHARVSPFGGGSVANHDGISLLAVFSYSIPGICISNTTRIINQAAFILIQENE